MKRFSTFVAVLALACAACPKSSDSSAGDDKTEDGDKGGKQKGKGKAKGTHEKGKGKGKTSGSSDPSSGTAGAKDDLEARVDKAIAKAMSDLHLPGVSITVVRDGKIALQKGYGVADLDSKKPVDATTTMGLASITKVFTTIAVMSLVDAKKIQLEDSYSKYVNDCPAAWKAITIHQLLAMQSGIASPGQAEKLKLADWKASVVWATAKPLLFPAGTKTNYSNVNFLLLGHLIESVTGKTYLDYLSTSVLTPAGMTSTSLTDDARATNYEWTDGKYVKAPILQGFSSGGLISNQVDLAKLDAAIRDKKLVTPASWDAIFTPQTMADGTSSGRGLGWDFVRDVKGKKRAGKGGDLPGGKTFFMEGVDEGVSVIVMANSHNKKLNGVAQAIFKEAINDKSPPEGDTIVDDGDDAM